MALLKRKRSGQSDPMSVVTRFVNACNRHDADSVAACLHADFDSIQPMYPARNFRGADQVRRNWQAIFDAEPGFRLTVLRQAASEDTVWLELHGAGRDAEVAGVFVMGILGDRVRWARIYSALIEPLPEGAEAAATSPATLREVPPLDESGDGVAVAAGGGERSEEELIAPVLDIDGGSRSRRRRSSRRRSHDADDLATEPAAEPVAEVEAEPAAMAAADTGMASEPEVVAVADVAAAEPEPEPEVMVEPVGAEATGAGSPAEPEVVAPAEAAAPEPEPAPEVLVEPASTETAAESSAADKEPVVVAGPVPEPAVVAPEPPAVEAVEPAPVPADDTLAVDINWDDLTPEAPGSSGAGAPATVSIEPDDDDVRPGKWLGRRRR